jgi:hypothetical protein
MSVNANKDNMDLGEEVVKRKKGRPRKNIMSNEPQPQSQQAQKVTSDTTPMQQYVEHKPEPEKKKRGRKKKEVVVEEIKQKKKRGRKAAVKYFSSSIRKKIPLTTVIQDNNNYILHLDIKNENADKKSLTYDTLSSAFSDMQLETSGDKLIDSVFEKLKNDEVENVKKEIREMLDNDQSILADYLEKNNKREQQEEDDQEDEETDNTDHHCQETSLRDLYEKRIEFRESQDKQLVNKLENLHQDEGFLNELLHESSSNQEGKDINSQRQEYQTTNRKQGYFELLYNFVHNEEWLAKTDVCCWWCCHRFDTIPLGLPMDFHARVKKFRVKGVFCSFACMMSYKADYHYGASDYLIKYLYKKITGEGCYGVNLEKAPPRCALKMFGGELTIEEFRNSSKEHKVYKMVEYPMYVSRDYVEEVDISNVKTINTRLFDEHTFNRVVNLDEKRVQDAKHRLLQMEKTTVTLGNTIDKFIKMT